MNDSILFPVAGRVRTRRSVWISLALGLCILGGGAIASSPAAAEGWAYDLAGELMSPFCPGRTLSSCPSPQAAELVQWISVQEAAGVSQDEVIEILVAKWGEEILGAPPAEGITLWAYIFPVLGFVVLGGIALFAIRGMVGGSKEALASGDGPETGAAASPTPSAPEALVPGVPTGPLGEDEKAELARIVQQEIARRA